VQSALINRILGRRRARTANTPGVTRSLQWIRVRTDETKTKKKEFELLDSPGVIPANLVDQDDAALLAACNCIGQAAYDNQVRKTVDVIA
jgi:ribosome biogenesis GTPase A